MATWSAWCSNYRMRAQAGSATAPNQQSGWCGHSAVLRRPGRREPPINPGTGQRCRSSGLPSAPPPTPRAATRSTLYRCLTSEYRYRSCSSHQNGSTSSNIYKHRLVKVHRKLLIWSKKLSCCSCCSFWRGNLKQNVVHKKCLSLGPR